MNNVDTYIKYFIICDSSLYKTIAVVQLNRQITTVRFAILTYFLYDSFRFATNAAFLISPKMSLNTVESATAHVRDAAILAQGSYGSWKT